MKNLFKFFALAYFISWLLWLPLYLPYFDIYLLPAFPLLHAIGSLGPLIAAFIMNYFEKGKVGIQDLIKSMFLLREPVLFLVALLSPFIILLLAALTNYFINHRWIELRNISHNTEFPQFNFIITFFYNLLFFGYGEETGWKGFALPRLQLKFSALVSSIIFTFFWAVWHIPLFLFRPGYASMDFQAIAGWFFSLLTGSILLTWLFNSSRGSIFICALFHATTDIVFLTDFSDKNMVNYTGILITVWGLVTIPVLILKNRQKIKG